MCSERLLAELKFHAIVPRNILMTGHASSVYAVLDLDGILLVFFCVVINNNKMTPPESPQCVRQSEFCEYASQKTIDGDRCVMLM